MTYLLVPYPNYITQPLDIAAIIGCVPDKVITHTDPDARNHEQFILGIDPTLTTVILTTSVICINHIYRQFIYVEDELGNWKHPDEETYGKTPDMILIQVFDMDVRPKAFREKLHTAASEMKSGDVDAAIQYTRMLALGGAAL